MTCVYCDKPLNAGKKFCSRSCYYTSKIRLVERNCTTCGSAISRIPFLMKRVLVFCSKSCSASYYKTCTKHSEESKKLISKIAKDKGYGKWMIGKKGNSGSFKNGQFAKEKHPFWKGGITPINQVERHSGEYIEWRKKVFERDNYTCQICGNRGNKIHADHIKPFALYPELRTELSNGRTLCVSCHKIVTAEQLKTMWKNQYGKYSKQLNTQK